MKIWHLRQSNFLANLQFQYMMQCNIHHRHCVPQPVDQFTVLPNFVVNVPERFQAFAVIVTNSCMNHSTKQNDADPVCKYSMNLPMKNQRKMRSMRLKRMAPKDASVEPVTESMLSVQDVSETMIPKKMRQTKTPAQKKTPALKIPAQDRSPALKIPAQKRTPALKKMNQAQAILKMNVSRKRKEGRETETQTSKKKEVMMMPTIPTENGEGPSDSAHD